MDEITKMTAREYTVGGCTALLDAIGGAIHHIGNVHKYAREEDRPEKTLFVITTDGQENSSRHYSYRKIKEMVEHQQEKYGWEFLFLGANIDAIGEAERFGIRNDNAVNYKCDEDGTKLIYAELSEAICTFRASEPRQAVSADWKRNIEKDHRRRQ